MNTVSAGVACTRYSVVDCGAIGWACRMWENVKTGDSITVESDNAAACKLVFNSNVVAPRQWREKK